MSVNKKLTAALIASAVGVLSSPVCAEQANIQEEFQYQDLGTGADLRLAAAKKPAVPMDPTTASKKGSGGAPMDPTTAAKSKRGEPASPTTASNTKFYKGKPVADDEEDTKGSDGKCGQGTCGDGAKKKVPVDTSMNGKK